MTEIGFPTLGHALEDMQKTHEDIFDLVPVQFVAAQHAAARSGCVMVLKRQKTNLRDSLSYQVQREYLLKDVIKMTQTSEMSKIFRRGRI